MEITIDSLSSREFGLYNDTDSLKGTTDQIDKQLQEEGINDQYRSIHLAQVFAP